MNDLSSQTAELVQALEDGFRAIHFDLLAANVLLLAILVVVFFRRYK